MELHDAHVWEWIRECWEAVEDGFYRVVNNQFQTIEVKHDL